MPSKYVWVVQNLDWNAHKTFNTRDEAVREAERTVGNRSAANLGGAEEMTLYGPGDGTTSVMVRKFTREEAIAMEFIEENTDGP